MTEVSIIVPCLNETATIIRLLDGIYHQTMRRDEMEVIIADGYSQDGTREKILDYQVTHPDLRIIVVDNLKRTIPSGLNLAINTSTGRIILRLDAHSIPAADYVERCVLALDANKGENVGGIWVIKPGANTWIADSIAAAAAHPLGVGDAAYRHTTKSGYVDTVPFGAFRRSLLESVGYYDETLLTNEDYELNARIRSTGGRIWLDPDIRTEYIARANLNSLARQYFRYGYWKGRMLRRFPKTIRLRQIIPPAFVAGLVICSILAAFSAIFTVLLLVLITGYLSALIITGFWLAVKTKRGFHIIGIPLAMVTMHFCWGTGAWAGIAAQRT